MSKKDIDLFKTGDVDRYRKGLTAKQKEQWVKAANKMLEALLFKKESLLECEAEAVRHANALFTKTQSAEARDLTEREVISEGKRITTRYRLTLQEAEETDEFQMILPIGAFHSSFYGEIIITPAYCTALVAHWKERVMGNREPFIDTLHDRGKANGWIAALEVRDDGLYAKIKWTKMGEENVREGYFKYFSSDLGEVTDIGTGEKVWPVLIAVALCNTPVMNTMPQARLAETEDFKEDDESGIEEHPPGTNASVPRGGKGITPREDDPQNRGPSDSLMAGLNKEKGQEAMTLSPKNISLPLTDGAAAPGNGPSPGVAARETGDTPKEKKMELKEFLEQFENLTEEEKSAFLKELTREEEPGEDAETSGDLKKTLSSLENAVDEIEKIATRFSAPSPDTERDQKSIRDNEVEKKLIAKLEATAKLNEQLLERIVRMEKKDNEAQRNRVIETALAEGKILPRDREFWEQKFNADPGGIEEILTLMPGKSKMFSEAGTHGEPSPMTLSEEDRYLMKKLGLSEEDMSKYEGGVEC